ncbi:MAG TPA: M23 family metallopeptidase [Thermoanaerobaculia bacterium]|nr:M23 family metallopeptidase [Thermoanaerobaculia bacterium]
MRRHFLALVALVGVGTGGAADALEIRFQPADRVYVYENRGEGTPADLFSAVIQNLAFVNDAERPVTLRGARLEVLRDGRVVAAQQIEDEELAGHARTMHAYQQQGVLDAYDFQFQTSRYLKGVELAPSTTLAAGQGLVVSRRALLLVGLADAIRVVAEGKTEDGAAVTAEGGLTVVLHQSLNRYRLPVDGRWIAAAGPSLHGHHRWSSIQEFAFDLVRIGEGGLTHRGAGQRLADYYAYGEPVRVMEQGVVVAVLDGVEESDGDLQQSGESDEAFFQRTLEAQQRRLAKGFPYAMGNHVVIEHADGEHSHYAHLQTGSIAVAAGDRVARGEQIGRLGHSGNSTEPHLHVHLTDGPDVAHSRSLPLAFDEVRLFPGGVPVRHLHSGQILESVAPLSAAPAASP